MVFGAPLACDYKIVVAEGGCIDSDAMAIFDGELSRCSAGSCNVLLADKTRCGRETSALIAFDALNRPPVET